MKLPGGKKAVLLLVPLALAGGGFGYMQMSAAPAVAQTTPDPAPGELGPMLALDSRVINLKAGGAYRYAKVAVTVELRPEDKGFYKLTGEGRSTAEKTVISEHASDVPMLLDTLGQVVSARMSDELNSAAGRSALKTDLLHAVKGALGEEEVLDIFLTDFVMQ